jgi:hypothetical protein
VPFPITLEDRQYTAPSAADGIAVTAAGASWVNSAWVTLLASAPSDGLLTGLSIRHPFTSVYFGWLSTVHIDIGVGATPTVIATFAVHLDCRWFGGGHNEAGYIRCPIPIDGILSGQPIKARFRQSAAADIYPWNVSVTYLRTPLSGAIESTANAQYVLPVNADLQGFVISSDWGSSGWHTFAAGGDRVVVGIVAHAHQAAYHFEVDIGTGSVATATIPLYSANTNTVFPGVAEITPIRITGDLQARVRGRIAANVEIGLVCVDAPL